MEHHVQSANITSIDWMLAKGTIPLSAGDSRFMHLSPASRFLRRWTEPIDNVTFWSVYIPIITWKIKLSIRVDTMCYILYWKLHNPSWQCTLPTPLEPGEANPVEDRLMASPTAFQQVPHAQAHPCIRATRIIYPARELQSKQAQHVWYGWIGYLTSFPVDYGDISFLQRLW